MAEVDVFGAKSHAQAIGAWEGEQGIEWFLMPPRGQHRSPRAGVRSSDLPMLRISGLSRSGLLGNARIV
jgi:hypothetical protein